MLKVLIFVIFVFVPDAIAQSCKSYSEKDACDPDLIKYYMGGSEFVYDYKTKKITTMSPRYSNKSQVVLLFHDIDQDESSIPVIAVDSAFNTEYNREERVLSVITVDYSKIMDKTCFDISAGNVHYVGKCSGEFITALNPVDIYLVGYGVGASVMPVFGEHYPNPISRATALDPAGSPYGLGNITLITATAFAFFKDVINSNGNHYAIQSGDVDFYVNLGKAVQPGCEGKGDPLEVAKCSHDRSAFYFEESIYHPDNFWGFKCDYVKPNAYKCPNEPPYERMGDDVPYDIEGQYEVNTNANRPYGKGKPEDATTTTTKKLTTKIPTTKKVTTTKLTTKKVTTTKVTTKKVTTQKVTTKKTGVTASGGVHVTASGNAKTG